MQMRARHWSAATVVALVVGMMALSAPNSEAAGAGGVVGGVVATDTVWEAGSYAAGSTVQVPAGVTLTLSAGVQLTTSAATAFRVAGTLRVEGTAAAPARVSSSVWGGSLLVDVAGPDARVFVDHLQADEFPAIDGGEDVPAAFSMTNSRVWSRPGRNFSVLALTRLPAGSFIKGNEFALPDSVTVRTTGPTATVVEDNRWARGDLFLQGTGSVSFTGNAFEPGPGLALRTFGNFGTLDNPPTVLTAEGNYWGADTAGGIAARIDDHDDMSINVVHVDFEPFLTAAPPATVFAPLPPLDVTAVRGPRSATVSWTPPVSDGGDPTSAYTVTAQPSGQQVTVSGSSRQATFTGLTDGVASTFTVTASNSRGASLPSVQSAAVTPKSPPTVPTGVKATGSTRGATVSWTPVAGATTYSVVASPGGHAKTVWPYRTGSQPMQATVTGLTPGKSYRYTVVASNDAGSSAPSAASALVMAVDHPGVVARPRAVVKSTRAGKATVRVSWRAPASNGARISYYRVIGTRGLGMTKVRAPKQSLVFENLKAGRYTFRVSAWNWAGGSKAKYPVTVRIPAKR